jgi:capsid assembly protease
MRYSHIISQVVSTPWAILPAKLQAIMEMLAFVAAGGEYTAEAVRERIGAEAQAERAAAAAARAEAAGRAIAIIPIVGTLVQRAGMMEQTSGAVSTEQISRALRAALADNTVGSIILDMDSPGGAVNGIPELAEEIYRAREQKPILAVANTLAASAAYWLATAAGELSVSPSAEVGSIGVFAVHQDVSKAAEIEGVKTSYISAGKYKTEANPYEPLGDEARAAIQARVDDYYGMFTKGVARGRGVPLEQVRNGFGEGRVVGARQAVELGMADRVETIDEVIARLGKRRGAQGGKRADEDLDMRRRRLRLAGR